MLKIFRGGDYVFDYRPDFWSDDQEVKNWYTIRNVIFAIEKYNIRPKDVTFVMVFHAWVKTMIQTQR